MNMKEEGVLICERMGYGYGRGREGGGEVYRKGGGVFIKRKEWH